MLIKVFPDYTPKGARVEVVGRCIGCKSPAALLVSDGGTGVLVHFDKTHEIAELVEKLRKELSDAS